MGTTKTIEEMEHIIGHLINIATSAQILALRETQPHNLRELNTIVHNVTEAKKKAIGVRNGQKKDKQP